MLIPTANPHAQYETHRVEIDAALARVLQGGRYILGEEVQSFEREFAAYVGLQHGIGVGSGTDALYLALKACEIDRGDEVITVSHTAVATIAAIEMSGAIALLVDIDPQTYTLDAERLERAITARTKAIIIVHLYGAAAHLEAILSIADKHNLKVIEDCAQAHGALYQNRRVGAWGHIAAFSFYPTKNLGAIGDGGIILTDDETLAERARLLREYGWVKRYVSAISGWNSRLDALQAAILRVKLPHLDADNARRRAIAKLYDELLPNSLTKPSEPANCEHVYHLYVVRHAQRDRLARHLHQQGIGTGIHYPVPVHLQPAYKERFGGEGSLPHTERAAREILSLPIYPELADDQVRRVADAVQSFEQ